MAEAGIRHDGYAIPLHDHLGIVIERAGSPSRVTLALSDAVRGAVAPVHGGVVATLVDVACATTIAASFDPSTEIPVTTEMSVRYYRQPKVSPLVAEAELVHHGSRLVATECVVRDGAGAQVARANATFMIVPGYGSLGEGSGG